MNEEMKPKEDAEKEKGNAPHGINPPELDEKLKPKKRAIETFGQAHAIAKRLYEEANGDDGRLKTGAVISRKYSGEQPYKKSVIAATGQSWRNNFSTNPMGSVVDRSVPQLVDPLKNAETLTYSKLSEWHKDADFKTRQFRKRTTQLVRGWTGYSDLIDSISGQTYLYGNNVVMCMDGDWRPFSFAFDESFLPDGASSYAGEVPYFVVKVPVNLHKFLQKIENAKIAEAAGYNLEGCRLAANNAGPLRNNGDASQMEQAEAIREQAKLDSTTNGNTRIIWLYYTVVQEYQGGVNIWVTEAKHGHPVRVQEKVADRIEHILSLFTLQPTKRFYASKGAGRLLTNLHIAIDRSRNMAADQVYLSGLPIVKADQKQVATVTAVVRHPFLVVSKEAEVTGETVIFNAEAYDWLDNKLVGQMESIAGAFIPPKIQEGTTPNTKIEAAQKAERELAVRNGVLGRHVQQHGALMGMMQRWIYSKDNLKEAVRVFKQVQEKEAKGIKMIAHKVFKFIEWFFGAGEEKKVDAVPETKLADPEAVECIVNLLRDGLSLEEIAELALSPANNITGEGVDLDHQKHTEFALAKVGSPFYDQRELERMQAVDNLGQERAERVLLKEREDPNDEAMATRQQIQEWMAMLAGEEMPVSSLDLHRVHIPVLMERFDPILQQLATAPEEGMLSVAELAFTHLGNHMAMEPATPETQAQNEELLNGIKSIIDEATKVIEQMAKEAAAAGAEGAGALPPPVNGQPLQAGPDGSMGGMEEPPMTPEQEKLATEAALKGEEHAIKHRELDIKERELDMKQEQFAIQTTTAAMQKVADQAAQSRKEGMKDAEAERAEQFGRARDLAVAESKTQPPKP